MQKHMEQMKLCLLYTSDAADEARKIIENVFCLVLTAVEKEKILKINQFGTFEVRETKERKIVDPRGSGNLIHAKPRKYIKFRGSRATEKTL